MEYSERFYKILCKINKRCKDYFFWKKNVGNGYELDKYIDEIIKLSNELKSLREKQINEIN